MSILHDTKTYLGLMETTQHSIAKLRMPLTTLGHRDQLNRAKSATYRPSRLPRYGSWPNPASVHNLFRFA